MIAAQLLTLLVASAASASDASADASSTPDACTRYASATDAHAIWDSLRQGAAPACAEALTRGEAPALEKRIRDGISSHPDDQAHSRDTDAYALSCRFLGGPDREAAIRDALDRSGAHIDDYWWSQSIRECLAAALSSPNPSLVAAGSAYVERLRLQYVGTKRLPQPLNSTGVDEPLTSQALRNALAPLLREATQRDLDDRDYLYHLLCADLTSASTDLRDACSEGGPKLGAQRAEARSARESRLARTVLVVPNLILMVAVCALIWWKRQTRGAPIVASMLAGLTGLLAGAVLGSQMETHETDAFEGMARLLHSVVGAVICAPLLAWVVWRIVRGSEKTVVPVSCALAAGYLALVGWVVVAWT